MELPYQIYIALRYLKSKKRHRALSFTTAISIGGVSVGVMALLVVLSVMSGFHEDLQKKILGVNAHIIVLDFKGPIGDYKPLMGKLKEEPHILSASPFVFGQVMVSKDDRSQGVALRGIEPSADMEMKKYLKEGSLNELKKIRSIPGILLGSEMASRLDVMKDETIRIISPMGKMGPFGILPKVREFRVAGIFEVGMFEYDSNLVITDIESAQEFLEMGKAVTGIEVRIDDVYKAREVSEAVRDKLGFPYYGKDWIQMNRSLFAALKLEKLAMFVILTLIVLVAAFNIVSSLTMTVIEKEREIAILRAMGASKRGIMSIFMVQGFLIGLIGTIIGLAGGWGLSYVIDAYEIIKLPADVYYLSHLPAKIKPFDFAVVSVSAVIISFLATIYPAWQASRLNPVEPLRYE